MPPASPHPKPSITPVSIPHDLLNKYSRAIPRYTSYPTAPHFSDKITNIAYKSALQTLPDGQNLSLYIHIPYCDTLCWFCGCHTKITQKYQPIAQYLTALKAEMTTIAGLFNDQETHLPVTHIHFGGGSPTILSPHDFKGLMAHIKQLFSIKNQAEIAIEIDPRDIKDEMLVAIASSGINRISIGVQDFDPEVQQAINRIQTYDETKQIIDRLKQLGIDKVNIDIIYGLPKQTTEKIIDTAKKSIALGAERIALFGYAHVPWMKTHQKLIKDDDLPQIQQRYIQAESVANLFKNNGFAHIGLDHFAKYDDPMAIADKHHKLKRNFQGYTTDEATALIGFGASSISSLPNGYFQNQPSIPSYIKTANQHEITTIKGIILSIEDHVRRDMIEKIMCNLQISQTEVIEICIKHNYKNQQKMLELLDNLNNLEADGLVIKTHDKNQNSQSYKIPATKRAFLRVVAAQFDAYLPPISTQKDDSNKNIIKATSQPASKGRHSIAI